MSKSEIKEIEKNLALSATFQKYLLKHLDMLDNLPKGATIILNEDVTQAKKQKGIYRAIKKGNKWTLSPA